MLYFAMLNPKPNKNTNKQLNSKLNTNINHSKFKRALKFTKASNIRQAFTKTSKEALLFAKGWAKNPLQLGALFQTSQTFAKKLVPHIDWSGEYVLELGAGLGNLTQVILESDNSHTKAQNTKPENSNSDTQAKNNHQHSKFACVEVEQNFVTHLKNKFPHINIQQGSAEFLPELFPHMVGKVRTIVSLIPMVSLPTDLRKAILASCMKMLDKDGFILQGSYYWKPVVKHNDANINRIEFVWKNMPPIHLYKYTHKVA